MLCVGFHTVRHFILFSNFHRINLTHCINDIQSAFLLLALCISPIVFYCLFCDQCLCLCDGWLQDLGSFTFHHGYLIDCFRIFYVDSVESFLYRKVMEVKCDAS